QGRTNGGAPIHRAVVLPGGPNPGLRGIAGIHAHGLGDLRRCTGLQRAADRQAVVPCTGACRSVSSVGAATLYRIVRSSVSRDALALQRAAGGTRFRAGVQVRGGSEKVLFGRGRGTNARDSRSLLNI